MNSCRRRRSSGSGWRSPRGVTDIVSRTLSGRAGFREAKAVVGCRFGCRFSERELTENRKPRTENPVLRIPHRLITKQRVDAPVWTPNLVIPKGVSRPFRVWPEKLFALYWREHFRPAASEAFRQHSRFPPLV